MATVQRRIKTTSIVFLWMLISDTALAACQGMVLHAHRGAPAAPENSISAYIATAAGAWDGMETDIQQLRDGTWVLHHDALTGRVVASTRQQPVSLLSIADWQAARLKSRDQHVTNEAPGFLSRLIDEANGHSNKTLNIEIKQPHRSCSAAWSAIEQLSGGLKHGNWFLTSVDRENLKCARQHDKNGYLGLIVVDPKKMAQEQQNGYLRQLSRHIKKLNLSRQWLSDLKQQLHTPMGIHVDVDNLIENPQLLTTAKEMGVAIFTYSLENDRHHAKQLSSLKKATRLLPGGAIIDGDPETFCSGLDQALEARR